MATTDDRPDSKPVVQTGPAIKQKHLLAMGGKPNTGGSYAKGPKTPA